MCLAKLFQVFRRGSPSGNLPSPRYNLEDYILEGCPKTTVQNTNSMEPLIDIGHTVLLQEPLPYPQVGDIIIWSIGDRRVIHSIVEIGADAKDWYCRTQGLNLHQKDPEKIRLQDIEWLVVGVLWTDKYSNYIPPKGD
uniref:Putative peptidase n=1 Tax=viral metagenome TaxID=1070528 RepID=A0A6M3L4P9_9ZZZZ